MTDLIDHANRVNGKYTAPIFVTKLVDLLNLKQVSDLTGYSRSHVGKVVSNESPCCIALEKACKLEYIERTGAGKQTFLLTADKDDAERIFNILSSANLNYESKRVA